MEKGVIETELTVIKIANSSRLYRPLRENVTLCITLEMHVNDRENRPHHRKAPRVSIKTSTGITSRGDTGVHLVHL